MMANAIEAAPRIPAKETKSICLSLQRNGTSSRNIAAGLATNVRKSAVKSAGVATPGSLDGDARSPSMKKSSICISPVRLSKNRRLSSFSGIRLLPMTMPARYTARYPLPDSSSAPAYVISPAPSISASVRSGSLRRSFGIVCVSTSAMIAPAATPTTIWSTSIRATLAALMLPPSSRVITITVSIYENGSFEPLSTSSKDAV